MTNEQSTPSTTEVFPAPGQPPFHGFIFDLDGTVLDTLPDLVELTNQALALEGYGPRTTDEIHRFVGNGLKALMVQAVPDGVDEEAAERALARWKEVYQTYPNPYTQPYPSVVDTLEALKVRGCKLGVLSNKFDEGVHQIIDQKLPGIFDAVQGESPTVPRKPDPAGMKAMVERLGVTPQDAVYFGDSPNDILTAKRAGLFAVAVAWGYHPLEDFYAPSAVEPDLVIHSFDELLALAPQPGE